MIIMVAMGLLVLFVLWLFWSLIRLSDPKESKSDADELADEFIEAAEILRNKKTAKKKDVNKTD